MGFMLKVDEEPKEVDRELLLKITALLVHNTSVETGEGPVADALVEFDLTEEGHNTAMTQINQILALSKAASSIADLELLPRVFIAAGLLIGKQSYN